MLALRLQIMVEDAKDGTFACRTVASCHECEAEANGQTVQLQSTETENKLLKSLAQKIMEMAVRECGQNPHRIIEHNPGVGEKILDHDRLLSVFKKDEKDEEKNQ